MAEKITLATPIVGRWSVCKGYLAGLMGIPEERKKQVHVLLFDNSQDPMIEWLLGAFKLEQGSSFGSVNIHPLNMPKQSETKFDNSMESHAERFKLIAATYNEIKRIFYTKNTDYLWIVEDDIEIAPDTLDKHLRVFDSHKSAHVSASYSLQRHKSEFLDHWPLLWDLERTDLPGGDWSYQMVQKYPRQGVWVEPVGSAAFGSILIKKFVLQNIEFTDTYRGITGQDGCFGAQVKDQGYEMWADWSNKVKHISAGEEVVYL